MKKKIKSIKKMNAVLVGIAGSNNAFSLSLYNLKAYALQNPEIQKHWDIKVIQKPLINFGEKYNKKKLSNLVNEILSKKPNLIGFSCYMWNIDSFLKITEDIKKILPINSRVTISGKIGYYKNKYQITNPTYISSYTDSIKKKFSTYGLTEGLKEKKYNTIINEVLKNIPDLDEWLSDEILKKFDSISWKKALLELHNPKNIKKKGNFLNRLIFDEIISTFLINSVVKYFLLVNTSIVTLGNAPIFLRPVDCGAVIQWKGSINCFEKVSTSPFPKSILVGSVFSKIECPLNA